VIDINTDRILSLYFSIPHIHTFEGINPDSKDSITFHHTPDVSINACISHPAIVQHKPLLVFLHYWGGSSSTWYKLTSPDSPTSLCSAYPILAIDHRGWGKSTGPSQDNNTAYSISSMANDVALVLQQLASDQERKAILKHGFILIGYSMGAKVAMAILTTLPRDLLNCLRGLVLVAPAHPTPLLLPPEMQEQQKAAYETAESVRWSVNYILANPENLDEKGYRDGGSRQLARESVGQERVADVWYGGGCVRRAEEGSGTDG
jgi:pimeloyl-ACP methyl ester carboxylesterase